MTDLQYMINFDFSDFDTQLKSVTQSYTDLGATIRAISTQALEDADALQSRLTMLNASLTTFSTSLSTSFNALQMHIGETSGMLENMAKYSKDIASSFSSIDVTGGGPKTARQQLSDILPGMPSGSEEAAEQAEEAKAAAETAKGTAEAVLKQSQNTLEDVKKSQDDVKKEVGLITKMVQKELQSGKSGMMSLVSRGSMGVVGGGLFAGALTAMILGASEKARRDQERGEMMNEFAAMGEDLSSMASKHATKWFSSFQERAQFFYGINRKEVQGIIGQMRNAGFSAEDTMQKFGRGLGQVGKNVVTLTLGIDKHLELAGGSSMKNVITLVQDYGETLDAAAEKHMKISIAAQKSGMGVEKFINTVYSGSQSLMQFGIDLTDVVGIVKTLEKHYQGMGLGEQAAGGLAARAMGGIAAGIGGMSDSFMMVISEEMGGPTGFEGITGIKEGWRKFETGEDEGFLLKLTAAIGRWVQKMLPTGTRAEKIHLLQSQLPGGGFEGAAGLLDLNSKLGDLNATEEDISKEVKNLRGAFKTEGEKLSDLVKSQRNLINGMAKVGQGLLGMVGGLLGILIAGIRSFPALLLAAAEYINPLGDKSKAMQIFDNYEKNMGIQTQAVAAGAETFIEGAGDVGSATGNLAIQTLGKNIQSAATFDAGYGKFAEKESVEALAKTVASLDSKIYSGLAYLADAVGAQEQAAYFKQGSEYHQGLAEAGESRPRTKGAVNISDPIQAAADPNTPGSKPLNRIDTTAIIDGKVLRQALNNLKKGETSE